MKRDSVATSTGKEDSKPAAEQSKYLLLTKFYVPPVRSVHLLRPRLMDLLNGGMDKTLTLVSAPAGYGKTTLVSRWLNETRILSAWLSLDVGDNDPIRFLQYLIAAIQSVSPGIGKDLIGMFHGTQPAQYENVVNLLANELAAISGPLVLVLDDFHVINSEAVLNIIYHLVEHLPFQQHLVLLSRIDPPLPLARLRARNQLQEIRADQLRFTRDEIDTFLNDVMDLKLSAGDLSAMETRTEGWIAGLQLAALSMQKSADLHGFVSAFSGSHYYIMDYLVEEVFKNQSGKMATFLLQTSVLDHMCGGLCEAVVDPDPAALFNGQTMLEDLEKMNLFIIPLDNERRWYRYHHLFADVLRKRLEHQFPHRSPELHSRASRWYEQNGFIAEAIQEAIAAKDQDRAAQLIEGNGCFMLMSGELATFLNWTDAIEFQSDTHPWLAVQKAWALALSGKIDQVEPTLQSPERLLLPLEPTIEVKTLQGTIAAARAYCSNTQGDTKAAADYAHLALEKLPDCSSISRSIRSVATSILGDASWINGYLDKAADAYTEAVRIGKEADNLHMVIIASSNLADVLMDLGQLNRAGDIFNQSLELAVRPDGQRSPLAATVFAGLSKLSYEYNRLDEAAGFLRQCIDLCRLWGNNSLQAVAYARLGRLEQVRNNPEATQQAIWNLEQLSYQQPVSNKQSGSVNSDLLHLWLAQGNLEKLSQFVQESGPSNGGEITYQQESSHINLLHALLALEDYDACLALSTRLLQKAEAAKRKGQVIEILVLQSLILQAEKSWIRP